MSPLQTIIEIAEGAVDVLGIVQERSERIRAVEDGQAPSPPRYGRGVRRQPDPASPSSVEPSIECVTDATTSQESWVVHHGAERVECKSEQMARKVRDALRRG